MRTGSPLVFFSGVDWAHTWQRPHQIASRLAADRPVLWIDPLGLRSPRPSDLRRLVGRLRSRAAVRPPPGLTRLSPVAYLPFPQRAWAARWNGARLAAAAAAWLRSLGASRCALWTSTPAPAVLAAIDILAPAAVVYDCLDAFPLFHAADEASIRQAEEAVARRADLVLATSAVLADRMKTLNARTILVPNAGDAAHFATFGETPPDLAGLRWPILGYVGELGAWFDFELVVALARRRPEWSIVLVGPPARLGLSLPPNVRPLGPRPYAALPAYVARFDVCLLPFRRGPLAEAMDPVKVYEYLAAGRPVVSTPLPEVARHGALCRVADDAVTFEVAVEASLRDDPARERERRAYVAAAHTWDHRLAAIREAMASLPIPETATGRR